MKIFSFIFLSIITWHQTDLKGNQAVPDELVSQISVWAVSLAVCGPVLWSGRPVFTVDFLVIKTNVVCSKHKYMQSTTPCKIFIQCVFTSSKLA